MCNATLSRRDETVRFIEQCRGRFDAAVGMIQQPSVSHGYHTRLPSGSAVHPTRETLNFAVALLAAGTEQDHSLAAAMIERVVALQDADESSRTFGVWPYYLEEPLAQMDRPDHNWADFIGARLAHVVIEHGAKVPGAVLERARGALARAAQAIVRRNIIAEYTNIAVMGAGVAAAAGEACGVPEWIEYGRKKLAAVEQSVQ